MSVGTNIKKIRRAKNMTQKQLGDLCGLSESMIRQYELGYRNPKIETIEKISNALSVSVDELYSNSFDPTKNNMNAIKDLVQILDLMDEPDIREACTDQQIINARKKILKEMERRNMLLSISVILGDNNKVSSLFPKPPEDFKEHDVNSQQGTIHALIMAGFDPHLIAQYYDVDIDTTYAEKLVKLHSLTKEEYERLLEYKEIINSQKQN